MKTPAFFHYQASGEYVLDVPDDSEPEDEPQSGAGTKLLFEMDHASDDSMSENEVDDTPYMLADTEMFEKYDLDIVPDPSLIWTPTKYSPEQVCEFISLIQNLNLKVAPAARRARIHQSAAYTFHKEWERNGGTVLPGYKPASEVKPKGNNVKLTAKHSDFIESYVEENPCCIVKDLTAALCDEFEGLNVHQSTVYRHLTEKLAFTLTRTQPQVADRNSEDTLEARRQFVQFIEEQNIDFEKKCVFVDESGFLKNMLEVFHMAPNPPIFSYL
ncbi:hypothetical protein BJV82DRAFT_584101 [Fennellomyces sp. T-0311]|nr:hypothetical protein BJV82DRAFT_584101 [Fennellomyces sp. T-0311]